MAPVAPPTAPRLTPLLRRQDLAMYSRPPPLLLPRLPGVLAAGLRLCLRDAPRTRGDRSDPRNTLSLSSVQELMLLDCMLRPPLLPSLITVRLPLARECRDLPE